MNPYKVMNFMDALPRLEFHWKFRTVCEVSS